MTLREDERSTILTADSKVTLEEGIGDSRVFRDLEYAFCLQHIRIGDRVLDIGTSQPWFLLELWRRRCDVVTLDVDPGAMLRAYQVGVICVVASVTNLPFRAGFFSVVLCVSTIEHVPGEDDMIGMREIRRVAQGALLVLPFDESDNSLHEESGERRYDWSLIENRILPGWRILRRAHISVWDPILLKIGGWLSEECLYLSREWPT